MHQTSDLHSRDSRLAGLQPLATSLLAAPGGLYSVHSTPSGWATRRHLPTTAPEDLAGLRAPAGWDGVAQVYRNLVVAGAGPVDDEAAVCVTHLRCGATLAMLSVDVDDPRHPGLELSVLDGPIDDTGRRLLDLPSSPPGFGVAQVSAWAWLDEVWAALTSDDGPRYLGSWDSLAALHPGRDLVDSPTPDALAAGLAARCDRWGWGELRRSAAGTVDGLPGWAPFCRPEVQLTARQALWMDDAMYARHVATYMPEAWWLIDAIGSLLPDSVLATLVRTAALSGVTTTRSS